MMRSCLNCSARFQGTGLRCPPCAAKLERHRDAARGSRQARGYDSAHDQARVSLRASLPAPCGYCGRLVVADGRWVAAHVVDGKPEYGWMAAHHDCNERAKRRGAGEIFGTSCAPVPAARFPRGIFG